MGRIKLIFIAFSIAGICRLRPVESLKCDKIVTVSFPEILSYLGTVSFRAPGPIVNGIWTLHLKTTAPFTFIGGWHVRVTSDATRGQATFESAEKVNIKAGEEVSFRFRLHYGHRNVTPHVKVIQWERWTLCDGPFSLGASAQDLLEMGTLTEDTEESVMEEEKVGESNDNELRRRQGR